VLARPAPAASFCRGASLAWRGLQDACRAWAPLASYPHEPRLGDVDRGISWPPAPIFQLFHAGQARRRGLVARSFTAGRACVGRAVAQAKDFRRRFLAGLLRARGSVRFDGRMLYPPRFIGQNQVAATFLGWGLKPTVLGLCRRKFSHRAAPFSPKPLRAPGPPQGWNREAPHRSFLLRGRIS